MRRLRTYTCTIRTISERSKLLFNHCEVASYTNRYYFIRDVCILDPVLHSSIYVHQRKRYKYNVYADCMCVLRLLDITETVLMIYRDTDHLYIYADSKTELVKKHSDVF